MTYLEDEYVSEALYYQKQYGYPLMQSTGLTDKNGKEIYEGDIIRNNDTNWSINYQDGAWRMQHKGGGNHLLLLEPPHSEVIGNIYENPELLTPSEE